MRYVIGAVVGCLVLLGAAAAGAQAATVVTPLPHRDFPAAAGGGHIVAVHHSRARARR